MASKIKVQWPAIAGVFFLLTMIPASVLADIVEDFNDGELSEGFYISSWDGAGVYNNDNETWTLVTIGDQWRYVAMTSPRFTGDSFTAKFSCRNFTSAFDAWESASAWLKGQNFELFFTFGLNEELYFYLSSGYNAEGETAQYPDSILLEDLDDFPESLELEIEYNGPGQPVHFTYSLNGEARVLASELEITASAEAAGDFDYTVQLNGGETGPFGAEIDSIEILGGEIASTEGFTVHEMTLEVSDVQGQDHWYYRVGDSYGGPAFRDLVFPDAPYGNWEEPYWYDIEADPDQTNWADIIDLDTVGGPELSLHNDTSPRIEWESPYPESTSAIVAGTFKFESDWDEAIGVIMLNGEILWESFPLNTDGAVEEFRIEIPELNQGDLITFTADGVQWHWVQYVHTRILVEDSGSTGIRDWPLFE